MKNHLKNIYKTLHDSLIIIDVLMVRTMRLQQENNLQKRLIALQEKLVCELQKDIELKQQRIDNLKKALSYSENDPKQYESN